MGFRVEGFGWSSRTGVQMGDVQKGRFSQN